MAFESTTREPVDVVGDQPSSGARARRLGARTHLAVDSVEISSDDVGSGMEAGARSLSLPSLALAALLLGTIACASIPSTPGGPLQRAGVVQVSETQIYDVSRIDITTDQGGQQGFQRDAGGFYLLPVRLGGRVAITDWFDGAGDWGSADSGAEIRVGLPEGTRPLPFAFLVGARTDALALSLGRHNSTGQQHELRARLEAYPALLSPSAESPTRIHGVLALGASHGRHYHSFTVNYQASLLRDEDRMEGALGVELRRGRFVGSLIIMPYYVVRSSALTSLECDFGDCITAHVLGFQQSFGMAIALNLGLAFHQPRSGPATRGP